MNCSKEFTLEVLDPVFSQLVWAVTVLITANGGTTSGTGQGNDFTLSASSPNNPGSVAVKEIKGTMVYNGTGVARAATLFLNVLSVSGFPLGSGRQNLDGICRVKIDAVTVADIPAAQNETVGNYSDGFLLPAALGPHAIEVTVRIDSAEVGGFVTAMSYSGSIETD